MRLPFGQHPLAGLSSVARHFRLTRYCGLLLVLLAHLARAQPAAPGAADAGTVSEQVEAAYVQLGRLGEAARHAPNSADINQELTVIEANLQTIYQNLHQSGQVLSIRQLQTFQTVLGDMRADLGEWRTRLTATGKELSGVQQQLVALDRSFQQYQPQVMAAEDTVLAETLASVRRKQQRLLAQVQQQRRLSTRLQNRVSNNYIHLLELNDNVGLAFRQVGLRGLAPDAASLTRPAAANTTQQAKVTQLIRQLYAGERQLQAYYFGRHNASWLWTLAVGTLFFLWVFRNFRWAARHAPETALDRRNLTHLSPVPVAGSLIVALSLGPFFDLQAPAGYINLLLGLLLVVLTLHLWRVWPRALYRFWLAFGALTLLLTYGYALPAPGPGQRWLLLGLNLAAAALGWGWARRVRRSPDVARFVPLVLYLYLGLQLGAVVANLTGYLSLAKLLTSTGSNSLLQIMALAVFIRLITQAVHLQMQRIRLADGASVRFDFQLIERQLRLLLSALVLVLWLMVFLSNLNLYGLVHGALSFLLTRPLAFGSVTFTLLNVVLSGLILFLTFQAQRYVGYFFGDSEDSLNYDAIRRGAKPVVIRLVVFAVGFLLAAIASGLPLDKITLVFGALSVGIGLGLQNIVNNLVSGVILIFERPFHIGDYIEVAGKTGRVKDVGIRASKLVSLAGSEIIVPNGDLLSGHVINWTLSNNHMRVELDLKLASSAQLDQARQLISEEVTSNASTLPQVAPEILLRNVNGQVYDLKVLFWINNIRQEQALKSEILAGIHRRLTTAGIQLN
jgi:small-conductance mechanosensitive channel